MLFGENMKEHANVYFDESGFTGNRLLDSQQPIFSYAAVVIDDDDATALVDHIIKKYKIQNGEIKGGKLVKHNKGRRAIDEMLTSLNGKMRVSVSDKKYALAGKFFEYIFEPSLARINSVFYKLNFHKFVSTMLYLEFVSRGAYAEELFEEFESLILSYANLSDMLAERGISVNRSTIYRWFIEYSPKLRKKLRRNYQFIKTDSSWQLDETYVKVKGKWHYLYRAINKQGETLDFYFSHKRNKEAAYQFLKRCLRYYDIDNQPKTLNTDKHSSYANAIARLKKEGQLREDVEQRQVKCLNNGIESDHAPIKKLVVATGGFKLRK